MEDGAPSAVIDREFFAKDELRKADIDEDLLESLTPLSFNGDTSVTCK